MPDPIQAVSRRSAEASFGIDSASAMLHRLQRQIGRLAAAHTREDVTDFAIDASITACHLSDWIWSEIRSRNRKDLLPAIARKLSKRAAKLNNMDLTAYLCAMDQSGSLRLCCIVCNSAKHVKAELLHDEAEITTLASAGPALAGDTRGSFMVTPFFAPTEIGGVPADLVHSQRWVAKIVDDEQRRSALDVLQQAERFLAAFTAENALVD